MLKSFIIIINDDIYFMFYLLFMYFMFVVSDVGYCEESKSWKAMCYFQEWQNFNAKFFLCPWNSFCKTASQSSETNCGFVFKKIKPVNWRKKIFENEEK